MLYTGMPWHGIFLDEVINSCSQATNRVVDLIVRKMGRAYCTRPMSAKSTQWVRDQREILIEIFGGCCKTCGGADTLEFAHLEPTDTTGLGRGSYKRVKDVKQNPQAYTLLCQPCHKEKDGPLWRNRRDEYRRAKRRGSESYKRYNRKRKEKRDRERIDRQTRRSREKPILQRLKDGRRAGSERGNGTQSKNVERGYGGSERKKRPTKKRDG